MLQSIRSIFIVALAAAHVAAQDVSIPSALPVPRMQVVPLPEQQAAILRDGIEITRYYFHNQQERPFLFPIIGPSGRSVTRMGHPNDPVGHSHHNSVWLSHNDVNGQAFWSDTKGARVVHDRILRYIDGDDRAAIHTTNKWIGNDGKVLLKERRGMTAVPMEGGEWMLIIDTQLEPAGKEPVTFGKTPFGMMSVRVAKTMSVRFGGGLLRNSVGNECRLPAGATADSKLEASIDNAPNSTFWQHARWVDYSGPVAAGVIEGVTLMDHPRNVNHPSGFHTRADGWMCASLTLDAPITLEPGKTLVLRYGLWVHRGAPSVDAVNRVYESFASTPLEEISLKR